MLRRWDRLRDFPGVKLLLPAPHPAFVDRDAEAGAFRHLDMAAHYCERLNCDVLRQSGIGDGQPPVERRRGGGDMRGRRRGNAQLAGLAGNIDLHAEKHRRHPMLFFSRRYLRTNIMFRVKESSNRYTKIFLSAVHLGM